LTRAVPVCPLPLGEAAVSIGPSLVVDGKRYPGV
jgi:hypothetical protein